MTGIYQNNKFITLEVNAIINLYETGQLLNNSQNGNNEFNIGKYNYIIKNNEEAKKYYLMAIEKGNSKAMYNMGLLLHNNNQLEEAKKYYLMAIEKDNSKAMYNIKKIITPLECYYLYEKHNIPFTEEKTRDMHIFKNKISLLSKDDNCPICYEHSKCIPLECCHYLCITCYVKLYEEPCPVCRL